MSGYRLTVKEEHFYASTKQAVRALTEGLRTELHQAGSRIRIAVCMTPAERKCLTNRLAFLDNIANSRENNVFSKIL